MAGTRAEGGQGEKESVRTLLCTLAAPMRCDLLLALASGPDHVGGLARRLAMGADQVSHALRLLDEAGLVEYVIQGQRHVYQLAGRVELRKNGDLLSICIEACPGATITLEPGRSELEQLDGRPAQEAYRKPSRRVWSRGPSR